MVYSVLYYATEAITRAFVGLILKVAERVQRRRMVEERRRGEEGQASWGFFKVVNEAGVPEYTWVGRATGLKVSIPGLIRLPIAARELKRPPTRLHFSFAEAASKDWFKEIEWLAEQAERAARRGGSSAA